MFVGAALVAPIKNNKECKMFKVEVDNETLEKLRQMVADEDDGACVRLREYKLGGGCRTRLMLGLAIEEMDEDEDEKIEINGVPFIAESDFLQRYGKEFKASFNDEGQMVVEALGISED